MPKSQREWDVPQSSFSGIAFNFRPQQALCQDGDASRSVSSRVSDNVGDVECSGWAKEEVGNVFELGAKHTAVPLWLCASEDNITQFTKYIIYIIAPKAANVHGSHGAHMDFVIEKRTGRT
jgi:hypothetical protein